MPKYRKKPIVIEAVELKWSRESQEDAIKFTNGKGKRGLDGGVIIDTMEGRMVANTGDYIIKGVNGEFYPCKPDIFQKTYELVKEK